MIELKFGVPTKARSTKEEKYPNTAVITMLEHKGKGTAKKFELNKKASEILGVNEDEASVAISFMEGKVYMVKANGSEEESYKLTKNSPKSFSNSKVYDYFHKFLNLNTSQDNEFLVTEVSDSSYGEGKIYELSSMFTENNQEESTEEVEQLPEVQEAELATVEADNEIDNLPFN
jgi:hypothetical protein